MFVSTKEKKRRRKKGNHIILWMPHFLHYHITLYDSIWSCFLKIVKILKIIEIKFFMYSNVDLPKK